MKRIISSIAILLSIVSCLKEEMEPVTLSTPSKVTNTSISDVSINDIYGVLKREHQLTRSSEGADYQITPYLDENQDTLMYIVNFGNDGGWKIYSSDKRTPAVLAEGDTGRFSIEEGSPAVALWMRQVAKDMTRIRCSDDSELTFTEDEINSNKAYWTVPLSLVDLPKLPKGHWEETIYSRTVAYDTVQHMTARWDQGEPYNACCPYVKAPNQRAPAGCVAIAGSQVLLYLHDKLGVPEMMYSEGYCIGDINNFEKNFSKPSRDVWAQMDTSYHESSVGIRPEAVMISYIGAKINMHYHEGYSWALPKNLRTEVFEPYGISCSHGKYDEEIVKNSLQNQMPIIVTGSDQLIPVNFKIHSFVIDGYRRTRIEHQHWFHYVVDVPPSKPYPMPEEYVTYTYSSPEVVSIKINWGWSSQWRKGLNDGWYSLTAGWTVTNGGTYDYNHNLQMIYGFSVAQ